MRTSNGIAYFGDKELLGSLKDRVMNAIENDIMSIQVKNSDIVSFADFDGYSGEIVCYLDDVRWDDDYFRACYLKMAKLSAIGLSNVVVNTSVKSESYKGMSHDEKMDYFNTICKYIIGLVDVGAKVSVIDDGHDVFLGAVIVPLVHSMRKDLSDKVGYAINVKYGSNSSDKVVELGVKNVSVVNIEPFVENGDIVYDKSRALLGNVYSFFGKSDAMPSMFAVTSKMGLANVTNLFSLCVNVMGTVVSRLGGNSNGYSRGKSMPGYHATGFSENAGVVEAYKPNPNAGFIDFLQMLLFCVIICLIGVFIAIVLLII